MIDMVATMDMLRTPETATCLFLVLNCYVLLCVPSVGHTAHHGLNAIVHWVRGVTFSPQRTNMVTIGVSPVATTLSYFFGVRHLPFVNGGAALRKMGAVIVSRMSTASLNISMIEFALTGILAGAGLWLGMACKRYSAGMFNISMIALSSVLVTARNTEIDYTFSSSFAPNKQIKSKDLSAHTAAPDICGKNFSLVGISLPPRRFARFAPTIKTIGVFLGTVEVMRGMWKMTAAVAASLEGVIHRIHLCEIHRLWCSQNVGENVFSRSNR